MNLTDIYRSQVTTEEGKHLATQFGCPFYETSAALRHYIDDAFYTLIREIRRKEAQRVRTTTVCVSLGFHVKFNFCRHSPMDRAQRKLHPLDEVAGGGFARYLR